MTKKQTKKYIEKKSEKIRVLLRGDNEHDKEILQAQLDAVVAAKPRTTRRKKTKRDGD